MFKDEDIKSSDEIIHILFRRDHYSRLIEKSQFQSLEKFCEENNIELKIIDLPD